MTLNVRVPDVLGVGSEVVTPRGERGRIDQLLYLRRSTVDGVWAWPTGADILRWRAAVRRGLARETSERLDYVGTRVPVFEALAEEPQRWSEA